MKFQGDVDIDFADRDTILEHIKYIPAAMRNVRPIRKHATGVHITDVPYDAVNDMANIDYTDAEKRGYFKLDLLNVHVYGQVRDEQHLVQLMREPNWNKLYEKQFVEQLIHLGNHFDTIRKMPELINSIPRLSMLLALIRPGKKHLIGLPWNEVAKTVWDKDTEGYQFKRSHSVGYAHLVVVHMNLIEESTIIA